MLRFKVTMALLHGTHATETMPGRQTRKACCSRRNKLGSVITRWG